MSSKDICYELYGEKVLLPRILICLVLCLIVVCLGFCIRRRNSKSKNSLKTNVSDLPSSSSQQSQHKLRKYASIGFGIIFIWSSLIFLALQQYDFSFNVSTNNKQATSSRLVFSFTTTSKGVSRIQPTLDSLLDQTTPGFDKIYVIIPRKYRDQVVEIPPWLYQETSTTNLTSHFIGWKYTLASTLYHEKVSVILLETDFGPASKVLGTLLVEQDAETIIVYGDDDRLYPTQLSQRALHYSMEYPKDTLGVLGGWIGESSEWYCGRSLEMGPNSISFIGGAGAVVVKRKFFGLGQETMGAFQVMKLSKPCFLGDDFYLSHILSQKGIRRRLIYDSCWNFDHVPASYNHIGLSMQSSGHPGGPNVENYQNCIREVGDRIAYDGEFPYPFMFLVSRLWGAFRIVHNWYNGQTPAVAC